MLVDCISSSQCFADNKKIILAQKICDRHFGIGSDGLIFIEEHNLLDFKMDFLNPDGSRSFCGNGSRCAVKFYTDHIHRKEELIFQAVDDEHKAFISDENIALSVSLIKAPVYKKDDIIVDTGSPHYLRFSENDPGEDFIRIAQETRYSQEFKEQGINFSILIPSNDELVMRTYERGVENETLSCGTGVTAAAIATAKHLGWKPPIKVKTKGGDLAVTFEVINGAFSNIRLIGPAKYVFKGEYKWDE